MAQRSSGGVTAVLYPGPVCTRLARVLAMQPQPAMQHKLQHITKSPKPLSINNHRPRHPPPPHPSSINHNYPPLSMPRTFHRFSRLPTELRLQIWLYSMVPRIADWPAGELNPYNGPPVPIPLLLVNREARNAILPFYPKLFSSNDPMFPSDGVMFNGEIDVLHVQSDDLDALGDIASADLLQLQYLAVYNANDISGLYYQSTSDQVNDLPWYYDSEDQIIVRSCSELLQKPEKTRNIRKIYHCFLEPPIEYSPRRQGLESEQYKQAFRRQMEEVWSMARRDRLEDLIEIEMEMKPADVQEILEREMEETIKEELLMWNRVTNVVYYRELKVLRGIDPNYMPLVVQVFS
jgi:hypothetical protein